MKSLLSRLFAPQAQAKRPARGFKPRLENMEDRMVLSTTVGTADAGHTLVITGDNAADHVTIVQDDANDKITVIADGGSHTYASGQITKISIDLKGGDDTLSWKLADGSGYSFGKEADIKLGDGNDSADFEIGVGPNQGHWVQSSLSITVDAGAGDDSVNANFGHKHGGALDFTAKMGDGNDEAFARLWGDVSGGADVTFNLLGQKGNDTLGVWNTYDQDAYAYGSIDITHDSTVTLNVGGGEGADKINVVEAGEVEGKLTMLAHGDKGNDLVEAAVTLKAGSSGLVDLAVTGNDGNDRLAFSLTNQAVGDVKIARAVLDGGAGKDKYNWLSTTANVKKVNVEGTYPIIYIM